MLSVADAETTMTRGSAPDAPTLDPWSIDQPYPLIGGWSNRDVLRRQLNILMAVVGLIVLSPLMLLIALSVRLSSPGPILFKQVRVGLDRRAPIPDPGNWRRQIDFGGRLFTLYKFRTMTHVEGHPVQVWARKDDPRVFPVGRFLRRYRLDELPQLFNVLRGDMNIVGPRPEQPEIFLELRGAIPRYPRRQRVLPGITGLAQISQPYDTCLEDVRVKVAWDLDYIRRRSSLEDLRIMLRTVPFVVLKRSGW